MGVVASVYWVHGAGEMGVVMAVMASVYWVHGASEMGSGDGCSSKCILGAWC